MGDLADLFEETKWARFFNRKEVETIAKYLSLKEVEKGNLIFKEGARENYMAFLIEGEVAILKGSEDIFEKIVVTLKPGTHFGEMAFIDDEPRSASAYAKEKCTLLILSKTNFERLAEDHPKLGIKILKEIAKLISRRLRMTTGRLVYLRE